VGRPATYVELASGTTRDLTLYILVEGYSSGVDVEIYEGGRLLETATASSTSITTSDLVYGVVAADPSAFGALAQVDPVSGSGYLAQIALEDLPDTAAAYGGLDVLVLSDVDTGTLSAAQLSAIEARATERDRGVGQLGWAPVGDWRARLATHGCRPWRAAAAYAHGDDHG